MMFRFLKLNHELRLYYSWFSSLNCEILTSPSSTPNISVYLKYRKKVVLLKKTLLKCPVISGQFLYIYIYIYLCVSVCAFTFYLVCSLPVLKYCHHWKVNIFLSIKKKAIWVVYHVIMGLVWFLFWFNLIFLEGIICCSPHPKLYGNKKICVRISHNWSVT